MKQLLFSLKYLHLQKYFNKNIYKLFIFYCFYNVSIFKEEVIITINSMNLMLLF